MIVPSKVRDLGPFVDAGLLGAAGLRFATEFFGAEKGSVQIAAAFAVEAVQASDSCLELAHVAERFVPSAHLRVAAGTLPAQADPTAETVAAAEAVDAPVQQELPWPDADASPIPEAVVSAGDQIAEDSLPWPELQGWIADLKASDLVDAVGERQGRSPLVLQGDRLFLRRFWLDELEIADMLRGLLDDANATGDNRISTQTEVLDGFFPLAKVDPANLPKAAAQVALDNRLTVLTGGPGTGKTWTLARVLALIWAEQPAFDVALVAPTGKAAQRMKEAVIGAASGLDDQLGQRLHDIEPMTLHRLLGLRPGERPFRNAQNPLAHDVVVVDEASMISLPLMGDLARAMSPRARLVLVGDPYQLASVEAGSILDDLVQPESVVAPVVAALKVNHRSTRNLDGLFSAVNAGDADSVVELCRTGGADGAIDWIEVDDHAEPADIEVALQPLLDGVVGQSARELMDAAAQDDPARCAELTTSCKVLAATRYGRLGVEAWTDRIERLVVPDRARHTRWYVGRPVIVTRNDYINGLFNGDSGVVLDSGVLFPPDRWIPPAQLADIDTWWAMTVHKSQGSEFDHVVVSLGGSSGGLCTRELLYTAVTRARERVTLIASEETLRDAVGRRIRRASGLQELLRS